MFAFRSTGLKKYFSNDNLVRLGVNVFVTLHLDYSNSILYRLPKYEKEKTLTRPKRSGTSSHRNKQIGSHHTGFARSTLLSKE